MSHSKRGGSGIWKQPYKLFRSLRAWSSSSLIALYFSFWLYSSSARQRAEKAWEQGANADMCRWGGKRKDKDGGFRTEKTGVRQHTRKKTHDNCTFQVIYGLLQLCNGPFGKFGAVFRLLRDGRRGHTPPITGAAAMNIPLSVCHSWF